MLPPPKGGGFGVTDSSPVPNQVRLKTSRQRRAEGLRAPRSYPLVLGPPNDSLATALRTLHLRDHRPPAFAPKAKAHRDSDSCDGGRKYRRMLKPSPKGEGFDPPSR